MEANRAEAEKCVEIAQKNLREGNREKAVKFLDKADRLCPNMDKVKGERTHAVMHLFGGMKFIWNLFLELRKYLETPEDETADYGTFGHYQQANSKWD